MLEIVGRPMLREMLLYVLGTPLPVSADDAGRALHVHRTVARRRLEQLRDAGLLHVQPVRRSGRTGRGAGRPANLYSPAGAWPAVEFPARHVPELLSRLVDAVPGEDRGRELRRAGEDYGRVLADAASLAPVGDPQAGLDHASDAMRSLGFPVEVRSVDDREAVLTTRACPLRSFVVERPEVAWVDRGMWAGLVERAVTGVDASSAECDTRSCRDGDGPCTIEIAFAPADR